MKLNCIVDDCPETINYAGRGKKPQRCLTHTKQYTWEREKKRRQKIRETEAPNGIFTRACIHCGVAIQFPSRMGKGAGGRRPIQCDLCRRKEVGRAPRDWHIDTMKRHGLTIQEYWAMFDAQGQRCAICQTEEPTGKDKKFHIDHDHACCAGAYSCGKCIRGLLCTRCNVAIGMMDNNIETLLSAAAYIEKYETKRMLGSA